MGIRETKEIGVSEVPRLFTQYFKIKHILAVKERKKCKKVIPKIYSQIIQLLREKKKKSEIDKKGKRRRKRKKETKKKKNKKKLRKRKKRRTDKKKWKREKD